MPQAGANVYTQGYGSAPLANIGIVPFVTNVAPASTNITGPAGPFAVGQMWVNSTANTVYILTSYAPSNGSMLATWTVVS